MLRYTRAYHAGFSSGAFVSVTSCLAIHQFASKDGAVIAMIVLACISLVMAIVNWSNLIGKFGDL